MENEIEKEQEWFFTFGGRHEHHNGYIKICGTFETARQKMFNRFGDDWAFQYESADKAGVARFNLYEVKSDNDD